MKKAIQIKILVLIFLFFVCFGLQNCNVKAKSVCENNCKNSKTENKLNLMEKRSSDVFPSDDLIIKI